MAKAAHASATLYSIVETANVNGLIPFDYVNACLDELCKPEPDIDSLLPWNIKMWCGSLDAYNKQNPMNELMLNMLGAVYQFERDIMKQRQAEGIAQAKEKGVYEGRSSSMRLKADILNEYKDNISQRTIAKNRRYFSIYGSACY